MPDYLKIDSHQHFWQFDPVRDSWITDDMAVIRRNCLPRDLAPILQRHGFDGSVVVQSDQSEVENEFQLRNATNHAFIRGVVGWVDLRAENITERLAYYKQFDKLKGFRHVLQGEADQALMLTPAFKRGIGALREFGYTYDILIFPDQLRYAAELVASFPDQPFVLDHIAKPYIKDQKIDGWQQDIQALAAHDNVWCKVSGMVTEADWQHWKPTDFHPYLDVVFGAFGADKVMFGSDWPVCEVAGGYDRMLGVAQEYVTRLSPDEQALFWGGNATIFYKL